MGATCSCTDKSDVEGELRVDNVNQDYQNDHLQGKQKKKAKQSSGYDSVKLDETTVVS